MEREKYITLSIAPVLVKGLRDGLREKLSGMKEVGADPEIPASAHETLDAMLDSRWGDDASIQLTYQIGHRNRPIGVHRFAVLTHVLDPRFKQLHIIHPDRKADVWKWLEEETVKLVEGKEHQRAQENGGGFMLFNLFNALYASVLALLTFYLHVYRKCDGTRIS